MNQSQIDKDMNKTLKFLENLLLDVASDKVELKRPKQEVIKDLELQIQKGQKLLQTNQIP